MKTQKISQIYKWRQNLLIFFFALQRNFQYFILILLLLLLLSMKKHHIRGRTTYICSISRYFFDILPKDIFFLIFNNKNCDAQCFIVLCLSIQHTHALARIVSENSLAHYLQTDLSKKKSNQFLFHIHQRKRISIFVTCNLFPTNKCILLQQSPEITCTRCACFSTFLLSTAVPISDDKKSRFHKKKTVFLTTSSSALGCVV